MLQDRREKIIELLYEKRMLKASELVGMFNVSLETIRRDLEALEEKGYLERVYGGAVSKQKKGLEPEYEMREVKNYREKLAIAEKAVEFVENGDVLFIDIGTTTLEFAKALLRKRAVTVLTNSIPIAMLLSADENSKVYVLGGEVRKGELSLSGFLAESNSQLFHTDKAFLGVGGLTYENGITDYIAMESSLRRVILKNTQKVVALADYSKCGVTAMNAVCDVGRIDVLITDKKADKSLLSKLKTSGVEVVVMEPDTETDE